MSPVEDLAEVLDGLARARTAASDPDAPHVLMGERHVYPMSLPAAQLKVNPFEFFMLLALFLSGLAFVVAGVAVPVSVSVLLPPVWGFVWSLNVMLGSGAALVGGLWHRNVEKGLLVYQLGWGLAGIGALIYGFAVMARLATVGLYPGLLNLLIAAACFVRVAQVQQFFRIADMIADGRLLLPIPVLPEHLPVIPDLPGGGGDVDRGGG